MDLELIGTSVTSKGTVTASNSLTYTYNPDSLLVTPMCGEKYIKTWKCQPYSNVKNRSWKIRPSILLKKTDGKTSKVTATLYVDYFKLSGGLRTYTMSSKASCKISFKNHKKA